MRHITYDDCNNYIVNSVLGAQGQFVAAVVDQDLCRKPSRSLITIVEAMRRCDAVQERRRFGMNGPVIPVIRSADCSKDIVET